MVDELCHKINTDVLKIRLPLDSVDSVIYFFRSRFIEQLLKARLHQLFS